MIKTAFVTCVQLGKDCIKEIYRLGGKLEFMVTLKDDMAKDKSGRVYLDDLAEEHDVPLIKIRNVNDQEVIDAVRDCDIDWLFIIGWSQIAKPELLNAPKRGCMGMHPTLLPIGRGRASIPWAILKGLKETGVTMFRLDEGVDTGDIVGQGVIPLSSDITATELYRLVDNMHIELLRKHWKDITEDTVALTKQDGSKATEWPGRRPEDGEILSTMTMEEADRMVRAVTRPYPGAFLKDGGNVLRIWSASTSSGSGEIKLADGFLSPIDYEVEHE